MSETINKSIKNILRIYTGHPLDFILTRIHNFFNHGQHSRIYLSPYEILNHYSLFDPFKTNSEIRVRKNLDKFKRSINKPFLENEHLKNYKIGDQVLINNHTRENSLEPIFIGPYTVTETSYNSNRIKIKDKNKIIWESLRNVKPYFDDGGMM